MMSVKRVLKGWRLVSVPVLAYADFTPPFILEVDASYSGLGAILSQDKTGGSGQLLMLAKVWNPLSTM